MVKERYCSKEVSELLREKGFDEYCIAVYDGNATVTAFELYGEFSVKNSECDDEDVVTAPTNQMAMDFLQKKKNAFIYVKPFITTCDGKQKFNGLLTVNAYSNKI